ncbi:hypothetical protein ABI59_22410 [Acidobacteria bacterium Mor1]|nr:hypothetical protein ABI59_22410 [Acidobacteria bacterium Mor1]
MTHDVLIVGQGLAGTTLAWRLIERGRRVLVVDGDREAAASRVAAGLITPVTGKRFGVTPQFASLWAEAKAFYRGMETRLGRKLLHDAPPLRLFADGAERERFESLRERFADLVEEPGAINSEDFDGAHGGFRMTAGGRLRVGEYLDGSRQHFEDEGMFLAAHLDLAGELTVEQERVLLAGHGVEARYAVLCQGFAATRCPWFESLSFRPAKGEALTVRVPGLRSERTVHRQVWLAPEEGDLFRVGATYGWDSLDATPTPEGREELEGKLRGLLRRPYEVLDQQAAVRPIMSGRRPRAGLHPAHPSLGFLNGLGSKGSLLAPTVAAQLADLLCGHGEVSEAYRLELPAAPSRPPRLTEQAHAEVRRVLKPGDMAIDATAGNGYDTVFLAKCVTETGKVYAVDLQAAAVRAVEKRVFEESLPQVQVIQGNHGEIDALLPAGLAGRVGAVMFNLGYLPGGDKSVVTAPESTVTALDAAWKLLRPGGLLSVLAYRGHPGGQSEALAVSRWLGVDPARRVLEKPAEGTAHEREPVLWLVSRSS